MMANRWIGYLQAPKLGAKAEARAEANPKPTQEQHR